MPHSSEHMFVVCIRNDDHSVSLEKRKIYEVLPDADAEKHHQIRVIDESGEDYLYPEEYVVRVKLPRAAQQALVNVA